MTFTQEQRYHLATALSMAICVSEKGFEVSQAISREKEMFVYEVLQQEHLFHVLLDMVFKKVEAFQPSGEDSVIDLTYDTDDDAEVKDDSI